MTTHDLKVWPPFWEHCYLGIKTFEVRRDDRGFAVGDRLRLHEWDPTTEDYTGQWGTFEVTYKLDGGEFGVEDGHCVLGINRVRE